MRSLPFSKTPPSLPVARLPRGFSLVELLAVMAIVLILAGASVPALVGMGSSRGMDSGLRTLTGIMEQAREQAIARNTFVWVAFSRSLPGRNPGAGVVVIASRGGSDSLQWSTTPENLAVSGDLEVIQKAKALPGLTLVDASKISFPGLPTGAGFAPKSLEPVALRVSVGTESVEFDRAVQFTPTGEARVRSFSPLVEIGIHPQNQPTAPNSAVIRLAGLTGKTHVYRPQ